MSRLRGRCARPRGHPGSVPARPAGVQRAAGPTFETLTTRSACRPAARSLVALWHQSRLIPILVTQSVSRLRTSRCRAASAQRPAGTPPGRSPPPGIVAAPAQISLKGGGDRTLVSPLGREWTSGVGWPAAVRQPRQEALFFALQSLTTERGFAGRRRVVAGSAYFLPSPNRMRAGGAGRKDVCDEQAGSPVEGRQEGDGAVAFVDLRGVRLFCVGGPEGSRRGCERHGKSYLTLRRRGEAGDGGGSLTGGAIPSA